jgi:hypothetical protein
MLLYSAVCTSPGHLLVVLPSSVELEVLSNSIGMKWPNQETEIWLGGQGLAGGWGGLERTAEPLGRPSKERTKYSQEGWKGDLALQCLPGCFFHKDSLSFTSKNQILMMKNWFSWIIRNPDSLILRFVHKFLKKILTGFCISLTKFFLANGACISSLWRPFGPK